MKPFELDRESACPGSSQGCRLDSREVAACPLAIPSSSSGRGSHPRGRRQTRLDWMKGSGQSASRRWSWWPRFPGCLGPQKEHGRSHGHTDAEPGRSGAACKRASRSGYPKHPGRGRPSKPGCASPPSGRRIRGSRDRDRDRDRDLGGTLSLIGQGIARRTPSGHVAAPRPATWTRRPMRPQSRGEVEAANGRNAAGAARRRRPDDRPCP
jgi:hypothetical protein